MLNFLQSSKAEFFLYIFNKLIKKFLLIISIFCCVFYIFEILKLFEYISNGVSFLDFIIYLGVDFFIFLPTVLSISLLIAVLFVYNDLFVNNEFFLSYMLNLKIFFYPIIVLAGIVLLFSIQINFFLKPMASYKLKLMRNQFNMTIYQNIKSEVFQFGIKNSLFYAKDKSSNDFFKKIFVFLPNKKNNISISAKKSRTFLKKENLKRDLILDIRKGTAYNLNSKNPFLYTFDKAQILLQSLAPTSVNPHLKYYTLLDLNAKDNLIYKNIQKKIIYKYKSINLILACLSFSLLAWMLLPMNFFKKNGQSIVAFFIVSVFWLLYSLCLGWSQKGLATAHFIYLIPNLWIIIICAWLYCKRKIVMPLSERMLSF
ncbi:MAG: LptF/LptG family permease [Bdellovibrionales bacterium]|nr:LptF/LptG family permease [Bdellovibrionales bacterium]